jgi:ribonucleoside-diphosphate reductase beta chain
MTDDAGFTVVVHGKAGCPHCDDAKAFLEAAGIPYESMLHDDDVERVAFYDGLRLRGAARTVPQVVLVDVDDGQVFRIGGARELRASRVETLFR